jgi:hypothetical protein
MATACGGSHPHRPGARSEVSATLPRAPFGDAQFLFPSGTLGTWLESASRTPKRQHVMAEQKQAQNTCRDSVLQPLRNRLSGMTQRSN